MSSVVGYVWNPNTRKAGKEDKKFKASLGYIISGQAELHSETLSKTKTKILFFVFLRNSVWWKML